MNGEEFIRRVRRYARRRGLAIEIDYRQGKGIHATLYLGDHRTTVKQSEIGRGLLAAMLRDLGIDREEW